ncbi:MAG: hypothetical protein ACOH2S_27565 [Janthinobacterium svalbardensis]|uniref:Uncharacterized protein n=1 Tax=Janthinobacterium svalbardensis TaxID=368607 RepID=A0A290X069_9BURK|nr:hypothetical protein [Janthinobacterium svalbardensis]ATD62513.1 hypothetical protein CNX70_21955 [Janthinobacterium svalbardensis]
MNVIQKYTRAIGSSNLRDDAHHHSTEVLAAAALCRDLGTKLFRVKYAGDATSYASLLDAWREIVKTKAAHRTWPADVSPAKVAKLSLDHWLNDVCPACTGRCYEPVRGQATVLSDVSCKACAGTGTRAVQVQHKLLHLVEDMVEALHAMCKHAAGQTIKRLAEEMEF